MAKIVNFSDNAVLIGTSGADTLVSYGDNVQLWGGAGNDTYLIKENSFDNDVVTNAQVHENAGGGIDTVVFRGELFDFDGITLADNVENLTLGAYAEYGYGNA